MEPVRVKTERGIMTATLVDVENRNALGSALLSGPWISPLPMKT
jgi:hypothetical protein